MDTSPVSQTTSSATARLGLHYFPDTLHYREADLQTWLPVLVELGVSWLVLRSDVRRAIPEVFLRSLKQAGIEPLIQFQLPLNGLPDLKEMGLLFDLYARWGARYTVFFDRPNLRASWPATGWVQQDLVERFLDLYTPTASTALQNGLTPIFPPLEPGGSYWDTAFLSSALQAMQRRRQDALLQAQALSAYAWENGRSLNWGAGGPERWPKARAYQRAVEGQDQIGFRIFDWYETIARNVLAHDSPLVVFQAGRVQGSDSTAQPEMVADQLVRLLDGEEVADFVSPGQLLEPIPDYVMACNLWLLSAGEGSTARADAWFEEGGQALKTADQIRSLRREQQGEKRSAGMEKTLAGHEPCIQHYLLLPGGENGMADWYLEVIRPYVKKYHPTIGFSPEEAALAARVTVVGNAQSFPEDLFVRLAQAGCWVEQIHGDGTKIATELAER